jgi:LCP family protein required for cell wall assembly
VPSASAERQAERPSAPAQHPEASPPEREAAGARSRPARPLFRAAAIGNRRTSLRAGCATLLAAVLVALVAGIWLGSAAMRQVYALGTAISTQDPLSTQTGYMLGFGRVNLLVLGYGGGGHAGAYLTDSMMVISLIPNSGSTTLLSVPRDSWVEVPLASGQYGKINSAYEWGLANGYAGFPPGKQSAGAVAAQAVSDITGLDVPYWLTMDFQGFRKLVDALGGVTIAVPTAFTAQYPRNDDSSIDASWETIHFNTGAQHMDGERAIEYARARYVLDPPSEGTDFARSVRQQLLLRAILARARQVSAWSRLAGAAAALRGALTTNLSLLDLARFVQKMDFHHAHHIGLSTQNVLVNGTSVDGQAILLPASGDWGTVRQYVAGQLGH